MRIPLDRHSEEPLYRQIEGYVRQGILSGSLEPGTRLPAVRQLAADLGVNRITVENAYAELAADGLVAARVGSGTYVLEPWSFPGPEEGAEKPWPLWQQEVQVPSWGRWGIELEDLVLRGSCADPISLAEGTE